MQIKLDPIEVASPWQAALLRVSAFPVPTGELSPIRFLLQNLSEVLMQKYGLRHEILLQLWNLSPQTGSNLLSAHMKAWSPEFGLGVWPDRGAPQGWTEEAMVDAAAAVFRGDEPARPSHRLLRLTAAENQRIDTAAKMRGFGVQIELFSKDPVELIQERGRELFLPSIMEERFQGEPFYLPVLDRASLAAAGSAEQLDSWLCGVEVYLRESAEDKGVLILSRFPLESVLDEVAKLFASKQALQSL